MSQPSLFVIGDSISCYYGKYLETYVQGVMSYDRKGGTNVLKDLDDCTNGVNGGDSSMVLTYMREVVKHDWFNPNILLLNCGLHDTKWNVVEDRLQVPPDDYRVNITSILNLAKSKKIAPVWVNTTPLNPRTVKPPDIKIWHRQNDIDAYNTIATEIMRDHDVPIIDLNGFTSNLGADIYLNGTDHVHYNEETAAKQAAFIAGALNQLI